MKKDLSPLLKSKKYFEIIISDFPNTDFSDAKFKLSLIENTLASKENYIANYYLSQKMDTSHKEI